MKPFTRIYPLSLGTTWVTIEENPNRVGLLIQNLSVNIVYVATVPDTSQAIEVDGGAEYTTKSKGELLISASVAASSVRIQEDVYN